MRESNQKTLTFVFIVCFVCALLLSSLASLLKTAQENAKRLDRNKQMLLAAQILGYDGAFQIRNEDGVYIPARYDANLKILVPAAKGEKPDQKDVFAIYQARIHPFLVDEKGNLVSFNQAGINETEYIEKHQKSGYADLPYKLIYEITANGGDAVEGYVIPINGFGLWDAIYGYLAIASDGDTVLGATWYQQAETAGLGANISLPEWQRQFQNKQIFQPSANGTTDYARAPLGITVIKGNVKEVLGNSPKAKTSVDGISGASLTGKGVTDAYADCLAPYRPFLLKLRNHG